MELMPWLPQQHTLALARHLLWALVLGGAVSWLLRRRTRPVRLATLALVVLWASLPGPLSASYWLGLAFQLPSLTSAALGLLAMGMALRPVPGLAPGLTTPETRPLWRTLRWLAVGLGWLLLLDLLALLPLALYPWGFGTPALALALLVLLPLGWRFGGLRSAQPTLLMAAALLLVFVLTRWPSGNLWDALLDPLLWLGLQLQMLLNLRQRRARPEGAL
jgi:hypothetical protein